MQLCARRVIDFGANHHAVVLGCELGDAGVERLVVGLGVTDEYWEYILGSGGRFLCHELLSFHKMLLVVHGDRADGNAVLLFVELS